MSCLFNSLSYFLNEDSYSIRMKICDYLEENKPILDEIDTSFILKLENNDYIKKMRHMSTWGGAIEIQAACNIWKIKIIVKNIRDKNIKNIEFIPINNNIYDKIINIEWNGSHYEPIR